MEKTAPPSLRPPALVALVIGVLLLGGCAWLRGQQARIDAAVDFGQCLRPCVEKLAADLAAQEVTNVDAP